MLPDGGDLSYDHSQWHRFRVLILGRSERGHSSCHSADIEEYDRVAGDRLTQVILYFRLDSDGELV